jgi:hypothetical protein
MLLANNIDILYSVKLLRKLDKVRLLGRDMYTDALGWKLVKKSHSNGIRMKKLKRTSTK